MSEILGQVPDGKNNPYWERLAHGMQTSRAGEWFCNKITPLILPPLMLALRVALWPFRKKVPNGLSEISHNFRDHYSPSLYPTMAKTLEMECYKRWIPEEPSLEIGIGDGFFTSILLGERKLTIAGDLIYKTLQAAREYPMVRKAAVIDAQAIPLPANSLQGYIMNNLMHHLPDRKKALDEAYRVMRPGGIFAITDNTYGWVKSIWHIWLAGKLGLKGLQKRLIAAKLENSTQALIEDGEWWRAQAEPDKWEVLELKPIYSNPAYTLTSLFESLTYKQGGLVPAPILRRILRIPGSRWIINKCLPPIIDTLLAHDQEWCEKFGATFVFVALRKKAPSSERVSEVEWVCPVTHQVLRPEGDYLVSEGSRYPVLDDVPILVPYWQDLPVIQESFQKVAREGYMRFQT